MPFTCPGARHSPRAARWALALAASAALTGAALASATPAATPLAAASPRPAGAGDPVPVPGVTGQIHSADRAAAPISTTACVTQFGIRCYTPVQYRAAYDLNPLYAAGTTGAGETILLVDAFGSPTITSDLKTFDKQFGFPNPSLTIDKFGTIPPYNPADTTMTGWATETTLDVEYAHAIAPGARIVLAETPIAENEGTSGLPQMMKAEQSLINAGVPDVISQSFGATENTFPGFSTGNFASIKNLRYAFKDAATHGVTVLSASGDEGATNFESDGATLYSMRVNSWPSTDPLVTSVGGTALDLNNAGTRLKPDSVWSGSGGGVSGVFSRPAYQAPVSAVTGAHRGTPDIVMSGAGSGSCWIYSSFAPAGPSWSLVAGTSEATPIFAAVVALADQLAGHPLGQINPALYALGAKAGSGIVDVTSGNNSFGGVTGYTAGPGYDLASGWGTVDADTFAHALAAAGSGAVRDRM